MGYIRDLMTTMSSVVPDGGKQPPHPPITRKIKGGEIYPVGQ